MARRTMTFGTMPSKEEFDEACASKDPDSGRSVDEDGFSFGDDPRMGTDNLSRASGRMTAIAVRLHVSRASATKGFTGKNGKYNYAFKIEGVDPDFLGQPFGRQIDSLKAIQEFKKGAKSYHVGAKGKASLGAVKKWLSEEKPSQFYAQWEADSSNYKDDSVQVYYK